MIEVKNVVKSYGATKAVQDISFVAQPGEIFGLIGPNGAGKTTTIRMIMNIIAPDAGEILLNGRHLSEQAKNSIGYLPEERGLYKKMRVSELLAFLAEIKGGNAASCRERADTWLRRFDMQDWKNHKIDELSKGMAQKIQFIGTIAHDPAVLLFDEPFSGLDPVSQDLLLDAMLELKQAGKTILFSTHIMDHAEKICQKILLINKSRELVYGNLADIKASYGSPTVRLEFDGDSGFIQGLPYIKSSRAFPRAMEVELDDIRSADRLFVDLAGKLSIRRFEILEPSLHSIFVRLVSQTGEEESK